MPTKRAGGFGHPEHHLQIEGFEIASDPLLMSMWLGKHTERLRVITCGFVSTAHNPLRTAESIATRTTCWAGASGSVSFADIKRAGSTTSVFARTCKRSALGSELGTGHQPRLFRRIRRDRGQGVDARNILPPRKILDLPAGSFVNPHPHSVYADYGQGVAQDMRISEVGIAPRPLQSPHPQLYGGSSMTTAKFWAQYAGRPIVLAEDLNFCKTIWSVYRDEAAKHSHNIAPGDEAAGAVL